jgi:hypothetical protein
MAAAYQEGAGGQKGTFAVLIDQAGRRFCSWIMHLAKFEDGSSVMDNRHLHTKSMAVVNVKSLRWEGTTVWSRRREIDTGLSAAARYRSHLGFSVSLSKCRHQYQRRDNSMDIKSQI